MDVSQQSGIRKCIGLEELQRLLGCELTVGYLPEQGPFPLAPAAT